MSVDHTESYVPLASPVEVKTYKLEDGLAKHVSAIHKYVSIYIYIYVNICI